MQIEIYIQCQPETLFSFFTDPGKLIFIHADLPEEERVQHAKGWQQFMQALLLAAEGKVPGVESLSESM